MGRMHGECAWNCFLTSFSERAGLHVAASASSAGSRGKRRTIYPAAHVYELQWLTSNSA